MDMNLNLSTRNPGDGLDGLPLLWPGKKTDTSEPFSPTQRQLDEEAKSRMDDEGGSSGEAEDRPDAPEKAA